MRYCLLMPTENAPTDLHDLHDHYARNAVARGHAETCALVTTPRNWPTIMGLPECTCGIGGSRRP